jgi:iron-sulfur cluster insertion protein
MQLPPKVTSRAFARLAEINAARVRGTHCVWPSKGAAVRAFQYEIKLDSAAPDDLVLTGDGESVVVDSVSLPFLSGATIDFSEELIGARFVIDNPNASSSCGCGVSFSM